MLLCMGCWCCMEGWQQLALITEPRQQGSDPGGQSRAAEAAPMLLVFSSPCKLPAMSKGRSAAQQPSEPRLSAAMAAVDADASPSR